MSGSAKRGSSSKKSAPRRAESVRFEPVDKVIFIGGAPLLGRLVQEKEKAGVPIAVFTSPRHLTESVLPDGATLEDLLKANGVPYLCSVDINKDGRVDEFLTPHALGIGLGAAWTFEKPLVAKFESRLFDFMGIDLPRYRGGAHYTWQILARNKRCACNMQVVYGGEATFHLGPVVKRATYAFPSRCRIPQDYFDAAVPREAAFIQQFIKEAAAGKSFALRALDESASSFYPRLHTLSHGWINWDWTAPEIERFICAFDRPYPGASTLCAGRRILLKGCTLGHRQDADVFHPFHSGLVFRIFGGALHVAARGGTLIIHSATDEEGRDILGTIRLGDRFFSPRKMIDEAAGLNAFYDAEGVKK